MWERCRYSWVGASGEGGGGSGDEESPKNNFYHLKYGRDHGPDHGPDHLHKGKLKIYKVSFKMKFTHLEYGRDHGPDHLHKGKLKT